MTILYIILILVSYMIGVFTSSIFKKSKSQQKEEPKRKGLLNKSFSVTGILQSDKGTLDATFEVIEIERTSNKSKVKVVECWSSKSEYNSGSNYQQLVKMVDKCWISTNEIEWIEKSVEDKRDEKLNQILN